MTPIRHSNPSCCLRNKLQMSEVNKRKKKKIGAWGGVFKFKRDKLLN